MAVKTELFLVPMSAYSDELKILVRKDPTTDRQVLPNVSLRGDVLQRAAQEQLLREVLSNVQPKALDDWLLSARYRDRIVDCYDRTMLFEKNQSVAIVRAVAVPEDLAPGAKGVWMTPSALFSEDSLLSDDCKLFLRDTVELVPQWVRNTPYAFELLPPVFSIQELRILVGRLSRQEIDPGNFHRRLKRLDVLKPMVSGQRVHKWEYNWGNNEALRAEGLIP